MAYGEFRGPAAIDPGAQDLRHILTDMIGGDSGSELVDIDHLRLLDADAVLLCTHGLTDAVSEDRIAEVLAFRRASSEQCQLLVDLALRAGAADHVTAVIAQYQIPRQRSTWAEY